MIGIDVFEVRAGEVMVGGEEEMMRAKVLQVLATEPGELPWRPEFGAGLGRLRHRRNDIVTRELARVYARNALARWLPEVAITEVIVAAHGSHLELTVVTAATGTRFQLELT